MARYFVADGRTHPDPDPTLTVDQVREMLAQFMPELATAEVKETKRGEDTIYELIRKVGTKGQTRDIPPPPKQCRCGGTIVVRRTPDEAACDDCGRRWAYDVRYGWITQ